MIIKWVLPLSPQCLDGNNFLQKRATRAAGHMFMWQLHLHNLKSHMIFFFLPFLWNWQLAVYRLGTTMEAPKLFHPSVFTPTIFPFLYYDYDFAAVKQSLPCWRTPCQPQQDLLSPGLPWGLPYNRQRFLGTSNWEILSAADTQTRQEITTLPLASVPVLVPHFSELNMEPVGNLLQVETMGLSSLKELFVWSSTNFAQSKLCAYFLSHCSQWFAVLKYVCAGSMDSPIIFIVSFRKLLFPSKGYYCYSNYQLLFL